MKNTKNISRLILAYALMFVSQVFMSCAFSKTYFYMTEGEVNYIRPKIQPFLQTSDSTNWSAHGGVIFGPKSSKNMDIQPYYTGRDSVLYKWPRGTNNLHYQTEANGLDLAIQYHASKNYSFLILGTVKEVDADYLGSVYFAGRYQTYVDEWTFGGDFGLGAQRNRQYIEMQKQFLDPIYSNDSWLFSSPTGEYDTTYSYFSREDMNWGFSFILNLGLSYDLNYVEPYLTLSLLGLPTLLSEIEIPANAYISPIYSWDAGVTINLPYNTGLLLGVSAQSIKFAGGGASFSGYSGLRFEF